MRCGKKLHIENEASKFLTSLPYTACLKLGVSLYSFWNEICQKKIEADIRFVSGDKLTV